MDLEWWPIFGLRIRTPRLELRALTDENLDQLCTLIEGGVHPPGEMPFNFPWTDAARPEIQRSALLFHWRTRADWKPDAWHLPFGVYEGNTLVGQQDVLADQFAVRRVVATGSWVGLSHQGQGIGTEMRSAILHFAFAGLDAERAETDAFADNQRSLAVTAKNGYEPNGERVVARRDRPAITRHFVLTRTRWQATRRDDITVEGLDPCRPMFGI